MYEQAQPVRARIAGQSNELASAPRSHCIPWPVGQSGANGLIPRAHDNNSSHRWQEWRETSSDIYEEPEAVRLQIAKLSSPAQETGAQQTAPEARTPQDEVDATNDTPGPVDTSADEHEDKPGDRRSVCKLLACPENKGRANCSYRIMATAFVVVAALVTLGVVLMVFINKTSQLSTTVDILKRNLASERNRTAVLGKRLDQVGWPSALCPGGYTKWRGICYKAFNTKKNFWQSDLACHADGGTLAMPRDADTNAFLISLYKSVNERAYFWFGLHDQGKDEGTFRWVDGTALGNYSLWATGQPNNYRGWEDCVNFSPSRMNVTHKPKNIIQQAEKWYDGSCYIRIPFLCQVSLGHA